MKWQWKVKGGRATGWPVGRGNINNRFDVNANYDDWASRGIVFSDAGCFGICSRMKTYRHLSEQLFSFDNLLHAYEQAKRHKTTTHAVQEFDKNWQLSLCILLRELRTRTYEPRPLKKFILRDPKTRVICVSDFRDRIVHHALVNVLQPVFEPCFIYDSYASRKEKGTLPALQRFDSFLRKVTQNGTCVQNAQNANAVEGFVLKADIRHYFETVDQGILYDTLSQKIKDDEVLWLIRTILDNYHSGTPGKGMPLGNWTSQFFANVYLNKFDHFVKHTLKAKYYIRYVDDFAILHRWKSELQQYGQQIHTFLASLKLTL